MDDALAALPPLREIVERHALRPKKGLGQNFLFDLNLTRRIARQAAPLDKATVFEIGPGPGGLTRALLAEGAAHVVALERDERTRPILDELAAACPGRLSYHMGDALETDFNALAGEYPGRRVVVANLPYNVATPLIIGWLETEPWPPWYDSLTVMVQREVAERMVAEPGSKAYGRLSVLSQWRARVSILFDIPPSAFVPPPKVISSVVQFLPRAELEPCDLARLEAVVAAAFNQRRKMLRASLKGAAPQGMTVLEWLEEAELEPTLRAENLSVSDFVRLANTLA